MMYLVEVVEIADKYVTCVSKEGYQVEFAKTDISDKLKVGNFLEVTIHIPMKYAKGIE